MSYALVALGAALLLTIAFLRADAGRIARTLHLAGPVLVGLFGLAMVFTGRAGLGGMMISLAAGWLITGMRRVAQQRTPGRKSSVRSAALEMELDHDSGSLEGAVLAGRYEGRRLAELDLPAALSLRRELMGDAESLQLLETYLDGRFPLWREDPEANLGDGQRGAPAAGSMTKEEAYQILGLEAGAAAADIRKAHRRLMQRVHPDIGGSSFLAARINEAKDVLLSDQN